MKKNSVSTSPGPSTEVPSIAGCCSAMEGYFMGSLSMQGGAINCLGKVPPKRSIFPEYWRQTDRIRSESLSKRPSSPLTLSTHSRDSLERTMAIDTYTTRGIPKKITLPIAITTPPRNGSVQNKWRFPDSPPRFEELNTVSQVPRRSILPQRKVYMTTSAPSELEQVKSPPRSKIQPCDDPSICQSPSRSCMRESRFSGSPSRRRSSSVESEGSMVRFDLKKVDIVTFDKPQVSYSERGWSDQFTL